MSRELSRGEFLVCQLVAATLIAVVLGFLLIKGIESLSDASQLAGKSQQQAHSARPSKKNPRELTQQSLIAAPPSKLSPPGALPNDTAAVAHQQTKIVSEALKARGLQIARSLSTTEELDRDVTV